MSDLVVYLVVGVLGFIVGGVIGEFNIDAWSPYCWYGLAAVWGVYLFGSVCHSSGFDL
jgi:hypothetical protein